MEKKEQSAEEIRRILEEAFEKNCPVNLTIRNSEGKSKFTPDLLVEGFDGDDAVFLSSLDESGNPGAVASLELSHITEAELEIESFE